VSNAFSINTSNISSLFPSILLEKCSSQNKSVDQLEGDNQQKRFSYQLGKRILQKTISLDYLFPANHILLYKHISQLVMHNQLQIS